MVSRIMGFRVNDFNAWLSAFKSPQGSAMRESFDVKSYRVLRAVDDPGRMVIIMEWDSKEAAAKFLGSKELRETHAHSGGMELVETLDTGTFYETVDEHQY